MIDLVCYRVFKATVACISVLPSRALKWLDEMLAP